MLPQTFIELKTKTKIKAYEMHLKIHEHVSQKKQFTNFICSTSGERVLFKKCCWRRALAGLNNQNVIVLQE